MDPGDRIEGLRLARNRMPKRDTQTDGEARGETAKHLKQEGAGPLAQARLRGFQKAHQIVESGFHDPTISRTDSRVNLLRDEPGRDTFIAV